MPHLFDKFLPEYVYYGRIPAVGVFILTARCNLYCGFCRNHRAQNDRAAAGQELSAVEWLRLAGQARQTGMQYVLLTGGEVFLHPDFFEIYEGLVDLGLKISIDTNATRITPDIAARLAQTPPQRITVAVHGASEETYAGVCGDPGAFGHMLRGTRLLLESGLHVRLRTSLTRQNINDWETLIAMASALGADIHASYPIGSRCASGRLDAQEELDCESVLADNCKPDTLLPGADGLLAIGRQRISVLSGRHPGAFSCMAGHCAFTAKWDGALTPCALLHEPRLPYDRDVSFQSRWEQLKHLSDNVPGCIECAICRNRRQCESCPALLKAEENSFMQKAPRLCVQAQARIAYDTRGIPKPAEFANWPMNN